MSLKYFLFLSALLMLSISCNKTQPTLPASGMMKAMINGAQWESNYVFATLLNDSTIDLIGKVQSNKEPYFNENFGFRIKKNDLKQYLQSDSIPFANFYTSTPRGAQISVMFDVLPTDTLNNWVHITDAVNNYKEISGSFNLTFIKVNDGVDADNYPDTLKVTEGTFKVVLN